MTLRCAAPLDKNYIYAYVLFLVKEKSKEEKCVTQLPLQLIIPEFFLKNYM